VSCCSDIREPHTADEPRCGSPLCMASSVVQVKQNVSEAGSEFSNRESLFLRSIAGCVYIFVTTPEVGRKGGLLKFCASGVHRRWTKSRRSVFLKRSFVFPACKVSPSVLSILSDSPHSPSVVPHRVLRDFA